MGLSLSATPGSKPFALLATTQLLLHPATAQHFYWHVGLFKGLTGDIR